MQLYNYRKKRKKRFRFSYSEGYRNHHRRHRHHHSAHQKKKAGRIVLACFSVIVLLSVCGFGAFAYLRSSGKKELMAYAGKQQMEIEGAQAESGLVSRNGKKYRYNDEIITLLCMGIDQGSEAWEGEGESGENGQADAIFLLVLDQKSYSLRLIGISRDTMTDIATYDRQGNYVGESKNHLALAFSYGATKNEGAEFVKDAVSNLFYNLPIHGYAAIDWDALGKINDSVGGVTVTLTEDMVLGGEPFKSGDTIRLSGDQAKSFVRHRSDEAGSNNERMMRQKTYVNSFISEAKRAISKDPLLTADLYEQITSDMATSIGVNEAMYLASLLPSVHFSLDDIQAVEGTIRQGKRYEEFYVDEDKLTELILDTFYEEVQ